MITDLDVNTIESFLKKHSNVPVVVMFYGANCGPCKGTMPHYEAVASKLSEQGSSIKFAKYHNWENDEHKNLSSQRWRVNGVPGFRMFIDEMIIARREGGGDLNTMEGYIEAGMYIYNIMKDE